MARNEDYDKTIKSLPDSYPFPDVIYAWDLQAQGDCTLQFLFIEHMKNSRDFRFLITLIDSWIWR